MSMHARNMFAASAALAMLGLACSAPPALAQSAHAATAEGDWSGVFHLPQSARLALHISDAPGGGLTGKADSPDEGASGVDIDVHQTGDNLLVSTPANGGQRLELKWDAANADWTGQYFTTGGIYPITLEHGRPKPWPHVDGLDGDWTAEGTFGSTFLRLDLHVASTPATTTATVTSPDQPGVTLPVGAFSRTGDKVVFEIPVLRGDFSGQLAADGKTLAGEYDQSNLTAPVVFTRQ
ncbi:MAG: hypothetical protein GC155_10995 [Alphaproteobacteria bacterium]|nr:hypothetical protein [Alphaproteobacteria bacterium]